MLNKLKNVFGISEAITLAHVAKRIADGYYLKAAITGVVHVAKKVVDFGAKKAFSPVVAEIVTHAANLAISESTTDEVDEYPTRKLAKVAASTATMAAMGCFAPPLGLLLQYTATIAAESSADAVYDWYYGEDATPKKQELSSNRAKITR